MNQDGLHILEELLKNYPQIDSLKVIRDNIDTNLNTEFNNNKPSVYLLMDKDINLTNNSIDTLMQFVENGNVALVAVSQFSSYFSQKFAYSSLTLAKLFYCHFHLCSTTIFSINGVEYNVESSKFDVIVFSFSTSAATSFGKPGCFSSSSKYRILARSKPPK